MTKYNEWSCEKLQKPRKLLSLYKCLRIRDVYVIFKTKSEYILVCDNFLGHNIFSYNKSSHLIKLVNTHLNMELNLNDFKNREI